MKGNNRSRTSGREQYVTNQQTVMVLQILVTNVTATYQGYIGVPKTSSHFTKYLLN